MDLLSRHRFGELDGEAACAAGHVDEDWQMSQWGVDVVAMERRAARWQEVWAAAFILAGDHTGAGRKWVELARHFAAQGLRCLRVVMRRTGLKL